MKAWEITRKITDEAVPKLLTEEEQTWEASIEAGLADDEHLKVLWNSHVPGSYAPESIMISAIQATENMGRIVEGASELIAAGEKAVEENDMVALNKVSADLWYAVNNAKKDESSPYWDYKQYNSWDEFEADAKFPETKTYDKSKLVDSMYAGWMAQLVGGALGTMLEGYTTEAIRKSFGEVRDYLRKPSTYNDDITYEIAFLYAYEEKGKDITSYDIAQEWIGRVPSGWSAEEMALRNIRWGIRPPESGTVGNPFREWIGAQMRGAICGMVVPGDAKEAARLAWLDGEVSHANNGIMGEVFNAVLVAMSYSESDVRKITEECVEMIPEKSEYRAVVQFALDACKEADNWETAWAKCEKRFERYNWVHTYPNAAAQVVALWYGNGDFDETAYIIAMAGQDVDCNAAQILTAVGIIVGADNIDKRWTDPIGDELVTYMRTDRNTSVKALAERTANAVLD